MVLEAALGDIAATAKSLARQHRLVRDDGTISCWQCREREALLPSLHCSICLEAQWRALNIYNPCCEQREQTLQDKEGMRR